MFDVFLHAAQVQQASAASLVSEQSDLTRVDSSVAQNFTSQRKSEHLGKGERGYTCTALGRNTRKMCTRGVGICFVENIDFFFFGSFIECDFVGVT